MSESYIALPPDSTGKRLRARFRQVAGNPVYEQAVFPAELDTYYVWTGAVSFALDKHFLSVYNNLGSGYILRVRELRLVNLQTTSISGVSVQFDLYRTTSQSGGTAITPQPADQANAVWPENIVVAKEATVTNGALLYSVVTNNDEVATGLHHSLFLGNLVPNWPDTQPLVVRPGGGITLQCKTNTSVGSFGVLAVVTLEAE